MSSKLYVGDVGTKIVLDAGSLLKTQTLLRIKYTKPDGISGAWTAVLDSNTDRAYYITESGDLDVAGEWQLQLYVEMPTWTGHGETVRVKVYKAIVQTPFVVTPSPVSVVTVLPDPSIS